MRAIASGRLQASIVWHGAVPRITDPALADREWAANTDLSRAPDRVKIAAAKAQEGALFAAERPEKAGNPLESPQTLAKASAAEKVFRAKLAELKYRERAGQLVEAEAVKAGFIDSIVIARTKILGVPSKAKQRMPHTTLEDLATWEELLREALEELVAVLASKPKDVA